MKTMILERKAYMNLTCADCDNFAKSSICAGCTNYSLFVEYIPPMLTTKPLVNPSRILTDLTEGINPIANEFYVRNTESTPKEGTTFYKEVSDEEKRKEILDKLLKAEASIGTKGKKFDSDKVDWTLMPWKELEQVLEVLEFGAKKYSRDNWKHIEPARYEKAAMRHLISYATGEKIDPESGKSHLAHLMCNALFLMWNDNDKSM
jgi:hypothetical protein